MFEKEAEEYLIRNLCKTCLTICENNCPHAESEKRAFKDGAEYGYNKGKAETALLSQHILDLQKDKGNLTDKVRELEQQIEKMKRCSICKYSSDLGYCKIRCNGGECNKMDKWEIKEK